MAGAVSTRADDVTITLHPDAPRLRLQYIRLPSYRTMPQSVALQITRREIRRASGTRAAGDWGSKAFAGELFGKTGVVHGLRCAADFDATRSSLCVRPQAPSALPDSMKEISWKGVLFPQIPSYLYIVYEKSPEFMVYKNQLMVDTVNEAATADRYGLRGGRGVFDNVARTNAAVTQFMGQNTDETVFNNSLACRNIAQSQDSNAAILGLTIVVQSAIGSFAYRDQTAPYLQDRDQLWRHHIKNCHASYSDKGRAKWQDRKCCALLSSSEFMLGINSSSGTVFPITLDISVRFSVLWRTLL